jgi:dimethylhistidine N-methyltransferase
MKQLIDHGPSTSTMLKEVLIGLSQHQKSLPPKYFYDKKGSEIFEKICLLNEYYPARAEAEILTTYAQEISQLIGQESLILEPGSGAGQKIRFLIPHLMDPVGYVPIDIAKEMLLKMTEEIRSEYPLLKVSPICADFNQEMDLIVSINNTEKKRVVFFPGSTIGNFTPLEAVNFLKKTGKVIGHGGGLLIGIDLKKNPKTMIEAYDDAQGVTADFNLNLLERLNREVAASFDLDRFFHKAEYNEELGRIEMHLVSKESQYIRVNETVFRFRDGETIHTENSYKYTTDEFTELCAKARFKLRKFWKDQRNLFCVYYFEWE